jgi:hypothetical protein
MDGSQRRSEGFGKEKKRKEKKEEYKKTVGWRYVKLRGLSVQKE